MHVKLKKLIIRLAKSFSLEETTLLLLYCVYKRVREQRGLFTAIAKGMHITLKSRQLRYLIERLHKEEEKVKHEKRQYNAKNL